MARTTLSKLPPILALLLALWACQSGVEIIPGRSYFSQDFGYRPTSSVETDSADMKISGVYRFIRMSGREQPALSYLSRKGISSVLLADSLPVLENTWVRVRGKIEEAQVSNVGVAARMLKISDFEAERDLNPLLSRSKELLERYQEKLVQALAIEEWPQADSRNSEWRVLVDTVRERIIVSLAIFDRLYETEVDFVYHGPSDELERIYCHRWFRGE